MDKSASGSELHVFVLWSRARPLQERILADLAQRFTVVDAIELEWQPDRFSENLTSFYSTALPPGSEKERTCGTGPPLAIVIEDRQPRYGVRRTTRGLARVNLHTFAAKRRYRRWTGGGHRVHATLNRGEAQHDLYLLLGRTPSSYAATRWNRTIRIAPGELFGADGWASLDELCTAFEVTLPYVLLGDEAVLQGRRANAERLVVLARERWEPAKLARGAPLDPRDPTRAARVTVGGRSLTCEFVQTGDDPILEELLAHRVRTQDGVWIPPDSTRIPQRFR